MIIKMILIMIKMIWHDLHLLKEPSPKRFMKPLSAEWHLISEMDQEKSNYDTIAIRANTPPPRPLQEISRSNINIYQQYEVCYLEHLTVLQHAQISLLLKSMFIWFSHPQIIWFWYFDFSLGDLKVASIVLLGRVDPGWNLSQAGWGLTWLDWNSALHSMRRAFCDAVWGHNMP